MRHGKRGRNGGRPPFVDPAFADALAGGSERKSERKQTYKALQLCRQVQRVLTLELGGADQVLGEVYVTGVTPMGGPGHLLVHVSVPGHVAVAEVMARLQRAAPRLRAAVARAITRKRAPELSFIPVAPDSRPGQVAP